MLISTPYLSPPSPSGNHVFAVEVCGSISVFFISSFVFFLDYTFMLYHIFVFLCLAYFT